MGKSSLLSALTGTESEAAAYEFTTLTCIPGNIYYKGTKIQMLDLPGIIEGAASGKGRGRQVIAVAKSSDVVVIVLDAGKEQLKNHKEILENELETVGLRLNKRPPDMTFRKKKDGGVKFTPVVPVTKLGDDPQKTVQGICQEYKIHNADILVREDITVDQLIDVIEGNRKYVKCLYVYNKIDTVSIEDVDRLARQPHTMVLSVTQKLNLDRLLDALWKYLSLRRIYTKKKGCAPDLKEPVVLTEGRHGYTIEAFCKHIHQSIVRDFKYALVWGTSAIHTPQQCGLQHELHDEDVVQIATKTATEQKQDKEYTLRVQEHYDKQKEKKKKKGQLKT